MVPEGIIESDDRNRRERLRNCAYPRARHLHLVQHVESAFPGTRSKRYDGCEPPPLLRCCRRPGELAVEAVTPGVAGAPSMRASSRTSCGQEHLVLQSTCGFDSSGSHSGVEAGTDPRHESEEESAYTQA